MTVATNSREQKKIIAKAFEKTGCEMNAGLNFKLHDFGCAPRAGSRLAAGWRRRAAASARGLAADGVRSACACLQTAASRRSSRRPSAARAT